MPFVGVGCLLLIGASTWGWGAFWRGGVPEGARPVADPRLGVYLCQSKAISEVLKLVLKPSRPVLDAAQFLLRVRVDPRPGE